MDRSDSDFAGRMETASGDTGLATQLIDAAEAGSSVGATEKIPANGNMVVRLADGSEADYRAGVYLAREAHRNTIFRDIPFSEAKARAIFDKAMAQPNRFGLIYAVPGGGGPLAEDGLYGFGSVHAGEYFLGSGTLIATVQTLNISRNLSGKLLGGKVALRLMKAIRLWAKERGCSHILVHVTNGMSVSESDQFFRRCGLNTVGGNYVAAI
ncbi:GNAT superfamily N-acetyltransferase [Labrenzia sp. EL_195]|nr:GNAT superfamily N-acetyltransferase [Labrenzia sp. EL_195]